jgi:hypothetical protein
MESSHGALIVLFVAGLLVLALVRRRYPTVGLALIVVALLTLASGYVFHVAQRRLCVRQSCSSD